ncbi:MAG TPA: hypothetical protein VI279_03855 [Rhodocyclaceae bacterium]
MSAIRNEQAIAFDPALPLTTRPWKGRRMLSPSELDAVPTAFVWLAWAVFALGGCLCVMNFKLFVDWLRHRLRKPPKEPYKHVSAIPILGSLLVALMLRTLGSNPVVMVVGIVLIVIDTGGIPWMIGGFVYQLLRALVKAIR